MYEEVDENEGYYDEEDLGCDEGASGEIVDFLGGEALQPFSFGLKSKKPASAQAEVSNQFVFRRNAIGHRSRVFETIKTNFKTPASLTFSPSPDEPIQNTKLSPKHNKPVYRRQRPL